MTTKDHLNKTSEYDFTIVVPIYNEEENIPRLVGVLDEYTKSASVKTCVIYVDDGSRDNSLRLLHELCEDKPYMFILKFNRNHGLSAAIKAGIDHTFSPYVGYIDADLQTSPEDFELLLPHAGQYPIVMGIRTGRKDSLVKKASSKIANGFRRKMTGDGVADTGCPLKVLQTEYAKKIPFFTGMHRFMPALIMLQEGGKVMQVPVRHFPRVAGQSKFHLGNRMIGPLKDCFAYRWMKKRYIDYRVEETNL